MNKKNKIIFLTHWFPNKENPFFGIFIKNHADALSLKNDVTIVNFDIKQSKKVVKTSLIKSDNKNYTIRIESLFYKLLYYFIPLHYILFKILIKKYDINIKNFDFLFSNIIFPNGIIAGKIAEKYKIKHIHIEHWSKLNKFFKKDIYRKKGRITLAKCNNIICVSESLKKELSKQISKKISIIPNIINQNIFKQKINEYKSENIIFVAVANWQYPKNPFYFLEALNEVKKTHNNIELKIIGSGPILNDVKQNKYSYKISYMGVLDSKTIAEELNTSNFLLHGSDYETFSVIIIESLSTGTPVLVSNIGIASEVINDHNGFICGNTVNDWVKKINMAISKNYPPSIVSKSTKNIFSINTVALKFNEILAEKQP